MRVQDIFSILAVLNWQNKKLIEVKTYARNSLGWLSERKSFPRMVVNSLTKQVGDVLLATGAVDRAYVLFGD